MVTLARVIAGLAAVMLLTVSAMAEPIVETLEIEIEDRPGPPVVGEMIIATIRGTYDLTILREKLALPGRGAFEWVQLDRDEWTRPKIRGQAVLRMERRVALFPKEAGRLQFGPLEHVLDINTGRGGSEQRTVRAEPATVTVAPYPAPMAKGTLSARVLTLTDTLSADPGKLRDGETLTRTVVVQALGALPQMVPPQPSIREPWLITFTAPEERTLLITPDGPLTTVVWQWKLRPKTGEPAVLPAIPLRWFDAEARRMVTTWIPALPFGYASFDIEARGEHRFGAGVALALGGTAALGFATGLFVLLGGYRAGTVAGFRAMLDAWRRRNAARRMRRSARAGDFPALRREARRYVAAFGPPGPEAAEPFRALERYLFRRPAG